jgi:hypothetical protein
MLTDFVKEVVFAAAPALVVVVVFVATVVIGAWCDRRATPPAPPRRCASDDRVADLESVLLVRNATLEEMTDKIARLEESLEASHKEKEVPKITIDPVVCGMVTTATSTRPDPDPEKSRRLLAAGRACRAAGLPVPPDILKHFGGTLPEGDGTVTTEKKNTVIWDMKETKSDGGTLYNCSLIVPEGTTRIDMEFSAVARITNKA